MLQSISTNCHNLLGKDKFYFIFAACLGDVHESFSFQIKEAIQFLHELGTVQYFDNDFLRDQVVINPQWIVNVMSCVVSVKNSPIQVNIIHV